MTEYRVPFSYLTEVHPQFSADRPVHDEPPQVEYEDVEVEVDKHGRQRIVNRRKHSGHRHHGHLGPALKLPLEDFPPEPIDLEVGINQGPPVADRYFYQGVNSNELHPRDSQHPIMAPATRRSRYYKSHFYRKKPHFRYEPEPFASDFAPSSPNSTLWRFLGHVLLAISLIICFALLQNSTGRV